MNIFVSLPYTHADKAVIQKRFESACKYSAKLLKEGHIAISPIVTGHAILTVTDLPGDFEFWENYCYETLKVCNEVHVLCMPGWEESIGVEGEIQVAIALGLHIEYIELKDIE
jgi:hypothetical protein